MARLTDASIKAAKPAAVVRDLYDQGEQGLCLRLHPTGRKAWGVRIRIAGKQRRFDLGEYSANEKGVSLARARQLAREMKAAAVEGKDPAQVLRPPPSSVPTVTEAICIYMETKRDNRSWDQERKRFALHVEPVIGDKPVDKVSKAEIDNLIHALVRKGMRVEPNRVFINLKGFFNWVVLQRGYRNDHPMAGMKRPVKLEPAQERQKAGTVPLLDLDELARLWRLAPSLRSYALPDLVRCMVAVPLRRQEWTALRWAEVRQVVEDGWRGWALKIPAPRMKGGRPATVPLPTQVLAILDNRRRVTGRSDFVFSAPGTPDSPFAGWHRGGKALRKVVGSATKWTPHDIRRSVATALVRDLGTDEGLVKRVLQHSGESLLGVTSVYQRSQRLAEQAVALQKWCDFIEKVAAETGGETNVTQIDEARHA